MAGKNKKISVLMALWQSITKKKRKVQERTGQLTSRIKREERVQIFGTLRFRKAFGLLTVRDKTEKDFKQ